MTEPLGVSVEDAKRHLGNVSTATIYRLFDRDKLEKRKIGGRTVVTMSSIRALLDAPEGGKLAPVAA
jgi:hypothetical protein